MSDAVQEAVERVLREHQLQFKPYFMQPTCRCGWRELTRTTWQDHWGRHVAAELAKAGLLAQQQPDGLAAERRSCEQP